MAAPAAPAAPAVSHFPNTVTDAEVQMLRNRILAHIQARISAGERYSETKLAREARIAQQTLNDFLRSKTNSVTRLTKTKLLDFLEAHPNPVPVGQLGAAGAAPAPQLILPVPATFPIPATQAAGPLAALAELERQAFAQLFVQSSPAYGQNNTTGRVFVNSFSQFNGKTVAGPPSASA